MGIKRERKRNRGTKNLGEKHGREGKEGWRGVGGGIRMKKRVK